MPEAKRPLKVFLCHAHADRDPVRGLYARLTQDGVDAWLDKEKLLPGQDWELEIRKAVREADVVVVCLSKQFNQAGFRQKEVRLALDTAMEKPEGEIFIIPARLEECDTLESLRKWHWVDLFEDDGYEMLMRALRTRADRIGVTLQIKKGWLPKVNTQSADVKRTSALNEKLAEKKQEKPKKEISALNFFYRAVVGIVVLVVFAMMIIFGLSPLIDQYGVTPAATNLENSITVTPTSILISESPTPPALTPTSDSVVGSGCETSLMTSTDLYEIPAAKKIQSVNKDSLVSVLGSFDSEGWSLIKTEDGVQGWVNSSLLSRLAGCAVQEYGLVDSVLPNDEKIEFQDAFNGSTKFRFFLTSGTPEFVILDGGESVMHLGIGSVGRKIFVYLGDAQRSSETLRMVFNVNYENNGFLSLQWGKYYPHKELRVYPKTSTYALNNVTDKISTQIAVGNLVCGDSHSWDESNYLEIKYRSNEDLTVVQIDDCEPINFSKIGGFKDFFYITSYDLLSIDLYYLLISSPK